MAFDYPVNLDLEGRPALVVGGGPVAVERAEGLLASGAVVTVVTPAPSAALRALPVALHERPAWPADLDGMFLAIVTREDDSPVAELWAAANDRGVLFAALDDVPHCHFGAASIVRRGDLRVTISTAGRAPALSKRLRQRLETELDDAHGELVEVVDRARARLLPRRVPFAEWSRRWGAALADLDGLLALVRAGRAADAEEAIVDAVRRGSEVA